MSAYVLPKGTVVKVGAISTSLYSFLNNGIPENLPRVGLQSQVELPAFSKSEGIYVGELMAYFAAAAEFCQSTAEVFAAHEELLSQFVERLQNVRDQKPLMDGLEAVSMKIGLPIVLEIVLDEDCEVLADGHFENLEQSEKSWKHWRSVMLKRAGGIPAAWIKKFYFPRLLDYRDLSSNKTPRMLEQTIDCALMVGGLMQAWHKDSPADLLMAFRRQYGNINFSQGLAFETNSLERFFNFNSMLDPATRLLNQMTIWQDIDALAKKQGIPLQ
ncbi:hypothetical protein H8K52_16900 [Undibacterium seohonense]|uniref:Uncharacterized protein n=1 Tax=Undibacterium seohonense TaxID=1344950 RepID=A0ABR6X8X6_9BURK|nr:hypothetical protein [Undibacterium seohonense]MBC3809020.1 hypothetical protein [Undibacterium seohonense]